MSITHSDLKNSNYLKNDVFQRARAEVEEIIRNSIEPAQAEWEQVQDDQGKTWFELRLYFQGDSVSARFTPKEMASPRQIRSEARSLWGDLLRIRSEKQHRIVEQLLAQGD
jgi:hypothetical protein